MAAIICPSCHGNRGHEALIPVTEPRQGSIIDWLTCALCDGTGVVSKRRLAARQIGAHFRWHRLGGSGPERTANARSLADFSRGTDWDARALSQVERGISPFTAWGDVLDLAELYACDHAEQLEAMHSAGDATDD